MDEVTWYYAISSCGVIVMIILGFLNYYQSYIVRKSNLKIEVNRQVEIYQASPSLQIIARNKRQTNIVLEGASILYSSSFCNFKTLPYMINKVYFSLTNVAAHSNFPYSLQAESSCMILEPYDYIAYALLQKGLSGKVNIKIMFRDATGKKYPSKRVIFDMSESKHSSNPMSVNIL